MRQDAALVDAAARESMTKDDHRQGAVWVTDEEFAALVEEIEAAVARRTRTAPGNGRTRHLLSLVFVPDKTGTADGAG